MRYWDTSALAKLYFNEPDSKTFETHLATTGMAVTAELARWELFRVAARKEAEGFIGAGKAKIIFARFLADVSAGKITLVAFDAATESRYRDLVLRLHRLKPPTLARTWTAFTSQPRIPSARKKLLSPMLDSAKPLPRLV